jgi:twitching motility protein PilJ
MEGVSPEAVFLLGKDLNSFKEIAQGLLDGSPELRLTATKDAQTREQLEALIKLYEETRTQASAILGNLQGLVSAREAQSSIISDSEPLRRQLEGMQDKLSSQTGLGAGQFAALALAACSFCFAVSSPACNCWTAGVVRQRLKQKDAKRQEQEAKRVNDANQAAILRLMNELQSVAEGDLTRSHRDGRHHGRYRRLRELHGGRAALAGGQRAEHGDQGGADDGRGGPDLDRAAGGVQRTTA